MYGKGCLLRGKNNGMYGKSAYDIWLKKYGKEEADKRQREVNIKNSKSNSGKNNGFYGKKHKKETLKIIGIKSRLNLINRIKFFSNSNYPIKTNYNPRACQIIDEYGNENGYNFQHAMNGGEFYIKELGYWVDGYDKDKNVVVEYYEKHHKKQIERDEKRKQEIIEHLGCKFVEIFENNWNKR